MWIINDGLLRRDTWTELPPILYFTKNAYYSPKILLQYLRSGWSPLFQSNCLFSSLRRIRHHHHDHIHIIVSHQGWNLNSPRIEIVQGIMDTFSFIRTTVPGVLWTAQQRFRVSKSKSLGSSYYFWMLAWKQANENMKLLVFYSRTTLLIAYV